MSRRTTLPGADELFRVTTPRPEGVPQAPVLPAAIPVATPPATPPATSPTASPTARALLATSAPHEPEAEPHGSSVATLPASSRRAQPGSSTDAAASSADDQDDAEDAGTLDPPSSRRRVAVSRRSAKGQGAVDRRSSGRERHEEKITVYVSPEELFDLEHARLVLRGEHGIAIDRGRIVREAIAVVMADFDAKGAQSILVRRLGAL